jgi:hypothetical protein
MQSLKKHLKPGGYIYIDIPNLDDVMLSIFKIEGYADFYFREPHLSYFSPKTFSLLLKKAGFRGTIKTVQRYNVLNNMNWLQTGKPQGNFAIGNRIPTLASDGKDHSKARKDLNAFIQKADTEYKKILGNHSLGEALLFFGRSA